MARRLLPFLTFLLLAGFPLAPARALPPPGLSISATSGNSNTSVSATVTDAFLAGCDVTDTPPFIVLLNGPDGSTAQGFVNFGLEAGQHTITQALGAWAGGATLPTGTFWFQAYCNELGNPTNTVFSNSIAFAVTETAVYDGMALTGDPAGGTPDTQLTLTVGEFPAPNCESVDQPVTLVSSTNTDQIGGSGLQQSQNVDAPSGGPVVTTQTLQDWMGYAPDPGTTVYFWAQCDYGYPFNELTTYSNIVTFEIPSPSSPSTTAAPGASGASSSPAGAVGATPTFTG